MASARMWAPFAGALLLVVSSAAPARKPSMAARTSLAQASALVKVKRFADALEAANAALAAMPGWPKALRLRAKIHEGAAGPDSRLEALAEAKAGVDYGAMARSLTAAADDLEAYVKARPNAKNADALIERVGELRARASTAAKLGESAPQAASTNAANDARAPKAAEPANTGAAAAPTADAQAAAQPPPTKPAKPADPNDPCGADPAKCRTDCEGGDPRACADWGLHLREKDPVQAASVLQRSCEGGNPLACARYGDLLRWGQGVARDSALANQHYQKACDAGVDEGCAGLSGRLTLKKKWVELDQVIAKVCAGPKIASRPCDRIFTQLALHGAAHRSLYGSSEAETGSRQLALSTRMCSRGLSRGCHRLAYFYKEGNAPVAKDPARALSYFKRACELGSCDGLADAYEEGEITKVDYKLAAELRQRECAKEGDKVCLPVLKLRAAGKGFAKDPAPLYAHYRAECAAGKKRACWNLSQLFGSVLPKDQRRKYACFYHACALGMSPKICAEILSKYRPEHEQQCLGPESLPKP
jgi:hypothetical protein